MLKMYSESNVSAALIFLALRLQLQSSKKEPEMILIRVIFLASISLQLFAQLAFTASHSSEPTDASGLHSSDSSDASAPPTDPLVAKPIRQEEQDRSTYRQRREAGLRELTNFLGQGGG